MRCTLAYRRLLPSSPPALLYPAEVVSPSPTAASMMHYNSSQHCGGFDTDVKSPVPVHSPGVHANMAHIDAALVSLSMDPQAWVGMSTQPEFVDVSFGNRTEDGQQRLVHVGDGTNAGHGDHHLQAIYPLDMKMR
jgi:hypothetical protein